MFLRSLINMIRVINKLRTSTCVCSDKHYYRTKFCTHFTKYLQEFNMTEIVTWTFFSILVRHFFKNLVWNIPIAEILFRYILSNLLFYKETIWQFKTLNLLFSGLIHFIELFPMRMPSSYTNDCLENTGR